MNNDEYVNDSDTSTNSNEDYNTHIKKVRSSYMEIASLKHYTENKPTIIKNDNTQSIFYYQQSSNNLSNKYNDELYDQDLNDNKTFDDNIVHTNMDTNPSSSIHPTLISSHNHQYMGENIENDDKIDNSQSSPNNEHKKPKYSYAQLIIQAIHSFPGEQATLSQIYEYITKIYPYYQMRNKGWQNSVRHNLSLNCYFIRTPVKASTSSVDNNNNPPLKGGFWRLNPLCSKKLVEEGFNLKRNRKLPPLYLRKNEIPYYYFSGNDKIYDTNDFNLKSCYGNDEPTPKNISHSIDSILRPKYEHMGQYNNDTFFPSPTSSFRPNARNIPQQYFNPSEFTIPKYRMQTLQSNLRMEQPIPHIRNISLPPPTDSPPGYIHRHSTSNIRQYQLPNNPNIHNFNPPPNLQSNTQSYIVQHPSIYDFASYNERNNPNISLHNEQLFPSTPLSQRQQPYPNRNRLSYPQHSRINNNQDYLLFDYKRYNKP